MTRDQREASTDGGDSRADSAPPALPDHRCVINLSLLNAQRSTVRAPGDFVRDG